MFESAPIGPVNHSPIVWAAPRRLLLVTACIISVLLLGTGATPNSLESSIRQIQSSATVPDELERDWLVRRHRGVRNEARRDWLLGDRLRLE